jgi:hypothetical protein
MRFLAWLFLILTVAAVVLDWRAIAAGGEFVLHPLAAHWADLHAATLAQVEAAMQGAYWADYVAPVLAAPAAIVFGIAFLVFHVLGAVFSRPRRNYNSEPL